jgi:hypothetical protein
MKRWLKLSTLAAVAAIIGLLVLAAPGYAQGQGPGGGGRGGRWGGREQSLVAVAAEVLGLERTALVSELNAGRTIAEVAEDKGVAVDAIVDAVLAPRAEVLALALADGRLTQAQADAQLAAMEASITTRLTTPLAVTPRGTGAGYVDADGDGVCDTIGPRQPRGPRGGNR